MIVTPRALKQLEQIGLPARVYVEGGGCAGFSWHLTEREIQEPDDIQVSETLFIDPISLGLLESATLDYVTDLIGSRFDLTIPEATSKCGCGSSFSL